MAARLPPMSTLRAFEAAARHLSFTKAAEEIFVTQAAVSHQIRTLEEALGVKLFKRFNRALQLTPEGQRFLPAVRDALGLLTKAVDTLRAAEATGRLTVSVLPSFAGGWLMARLSRFRRLHPEIDVRLDATEHLVDFDREEVDAGIRYGDGDYPGLAVTPFLTEDYAPVCAPSLAADPTRPLRRPEDLRLHTLLHDDMKPDWAMWLREAEVEGVDAARGPWFSHSDLAVRAAIDGQGVALGRSVLTADALAEGRLVRPFDIALPGAFAYYFVCPREAVDRPKIKAFRDWLLAEVAGGTAPGAGAQTGGGGSWPA